METSFSHISLMQDKEGEERREEERIRRMVMGMGNWCYVKSFSFIFLNFLYFYQIYPILPEDAPMTHTLDVFGWAANDAGPVSPTCGYCDGAIFEAKPSQGWNGLPLKVSPSCTTRLEVQKSDPAPTVEVWMILKFRLIFRLTRLTTWPRATG